MAAALGLPVLAWAIRGPRVVAVTGNTVLFEGEEAGGWVLGRGRPARGASSSGETALSTPFG